MRKLVLNTLFKLLATPGVPSETMYDGLKTEVNASQLSGEFINGYLLLKN